MRRDVGEIHECMVTEMCEAEQQEIKGNLETAEVESYWWHHAKKSLKS